MRAFAAICAWFLLCLSCNPATSVQADPSKIELEELLPQAEEVSGWIPNGEAQVAAGDDLFLLINGGAEIYHEYGFVKCLLRTYGSGDGRSINVEIYEMKDPVAAFGIYTFKTGSEGTAADVGDQGWFESYYLQFCRGEFFVSVIALGEWEDTRTDILRIAAAIDQKLDGKSYLPPIVFLLPTENRKPNGITYLRGNLALFNHYLFAHEDIFALKEGVIGEYENYTVFIFRYADMEESRKWFENAGEHLKDSRLFHNYVSGTGQFEIEDRNNQRLAIKHFQSWILIAMADKNMNIKSIFESVEAFIQ
jgi:hypothetical protein